MRARPTSAGPFGSGGAAHDSDQDHLASDGFLETIGVRLAVRLRVARDYRARLLLVHVVEPPVYYGELGMAVPLPADFHESLQERLSRLVPVECGILVETILVEGNASQQILRVAEEHHCDLIILGTHARTGLSRVLLGSVAEDVIRHSRFPVLTLKTPTLLDATASESAEACAVVARQAEKKPSRSVLVI